MAERLEVETLCGRFAVARLAPDAPVPAWAAAPGALVSVTRTGHELSIVAPMEAVPDDVRAERGFAALRVVGPLAFDAVGVLARLSGALAAAEVPLLAISTFDTDVLLVREAHLDRARRALRALAIVTR
jgi:hypothetical protein